MADEVPPPVDPDAEGDKTRSQSRSSSGRSRGTKKLKTVHVKMRYGTTLFEPGGECQYCDSKAIGVFAEGSTKRERETDQDVTLMCSDHKGYRAYNYEKSHQDLDWEFYHFRGYKEVNRVGEERDVVFLGTVKCARCGQEAVGALLPLEGQDAEKFPDGIALCEDDWEEISEEIDESKYDWKRQKP